MCDSMHPQFIPLSQRRLIKLANALREDIQKNQIAYYDKRIPGRRFAARSLRALMILTGGFSVLFPLLGQIDGHAFWLALGCPRLAKASQLASPLTLSSCSTAVAALLLAFEKYYAHSGAWMRFVKASMDLQEAVRTFELDWPVLLLNSQLDITANQKALQRLHALRETCAGIGQAEFEGWQHAFQEGMAYTDTHKA